MNKLARLALAWLAISFGSSLADGEKKPAVQRFEIGKDESTAKFVARLPGDLGKRYPTLVMDLDCLRKGYPGFINRVEIGSENVFLVSSNGSRFLYDDGKKKTFAQQLDAADLQDTLALPYPLSNPTETLPQNSDPGRVRLDELFKALYGKDKAEVEKGLVKVNFCGRKVSFTKRHGAAESLEAVSKKLDALFVEKPELKKYVDDLGGTYNWRKIAKTERLSAHSFGISIDLNPKLGGYWQWSLRDLDTFSRKSYPTEIIEIFEQHGFIWGGKWYHYDLMHFEFRPELINQGTIAE